LLPRQFFHAMPADEKHDAMPTCRSAIYAAAADTFAATLPIWPFDAPAAATPPPPLMPATPAFSIYAAIAVLPAAVSYATPMPAACRYASNA
jgi:hypothetical protein